MRACAPCNMRNLPAAVPTSQRQRRCFKVQSSFSQQIFVSSAAYRLIRTRSASAEERDEPDLKRLISEEVQKAVTSGLAESVATLLANLSGTSVSPSQLGTGTENTGAAAQFSDHPATTSRSAHALSVPAALQDRIVRGEFIEFSCLLPNVLGAPKRESIQLQSGADPGFQRRGCVLKTRYIHKKT